MTPEKLAEGMFKFHIDNNASVTTGSYTPATKWFVIFKSWTGRTIEEHIAARPVRD